MGTPYMTAVGAPPDCRTRAWNRWKNRLVNFRIEECDQPRAANYYVAATGNDGNAGSIGAPWLSVARAQAAIDASAGNIGIWFNRGDRFLTAAGVTANKPNLTIGAYGTGAAPVITIHNQTATGGWSDAGGSGRWYRSVPSETAWILDRANPLAPYRHVANTATVTSTPRSWTWDGGTNTLHINPGVAINPNSPALTYEYAPKSQVEDDGCLITAAGDGSLIQDIDFYGFGCGYGVGGIGSSQYYGVRAHMTGTTCCVVRRCKSYYSGRHGMGQQGQGGSGGITTWIDCETGYFNDTANLGVNAYISYHDGNGQESIFQRCRDSFGALPWDSFAGGANMSTSNFYCHNGGGAVSLIITDENSTTIDATKTNYSHGGGWYNVHEGDCPGNDADPSTYRVWFRKPTVVHDGDCRWDFSEKTAIINPYYRVTIPSTFTSTQFHQATTSSKGIVINGIFLIRDLYLNSGTARYLTRASSNSTTRFYGTLIAINAYDTTSPGFATSWKFNDNVGSITLRNVILLNTGTKGLLPGVGNNSSRVSNVARYNVQESGSSGIDQGPNGIVLTQPVAVFVGMVAGGAADGIEYDQYDNPRPALPTIGPIEAAPLKLFLARVA